MIPVHGFGLGCWGGFYCFGFLQEQNVPCVNWDCH